MTRHSEAEAIRQPEHQTFNIGVKALILQDNRLMLLKRRDHNAWEMPGGRINVGEEIEETLLRELAEELPGLGPFAVGGIIHAQPTEFTLPNGNRLMLLFLAVHAKLRLPAEVILSAEHEAMTWLTAAEFEGLKLQPQVRAAGAAAFRRIG